MSERRISVGELIRRAANGWSSSHYDLALELVEAWKELLDAPVQRGKAGDGCLAFTTDLSCIRLRGMNDVPCLLLAAGKDAKGAVERFCEDALAPGRLPLILCLSEAELEQARMAMKNVRCVVLAPRQVRQILDAEQPRKALAALLRQQLPIQSLIPYNYLLPAQGNIFFGRDLELNKLLNEEDVSFAIAGPSRAGKTSLVKQYLRRLIANGNRRATRVFEVDFYACNDTTADGTARYLAMKIESSSRSHRMTANDIVEFLRYQRRVLGGPPELLLDEIDEVCHSTTFRLVGDAARHGLCRLVLCGRAQLLKMMLTQNSPLACRLVLLRPGPLEEDAARDLLVEPLTDLGFTIDQPDRVVKQVFQLTGRLPHLLQFYGKKLVELAEKSRTVSLSDVDTLHWDFESAQYFTSPLSDLQDPDTRLLALCLLGQNCRQVTLASLQELQAGEGLSLNHARMIQILNDLVICNVLRWERGSFYIANDALPRYAAELGFLDKGLEEARDAVASGGHRTMHDH